MLFRSIGPGVVGGALLEQLASQQARLRDDFHVDLRLRGVMTSRSMALSDAAIPFDGWKDALATGQPADVARFTAHIQADHLPHAVIIDCSASADVAARYADWLGAGIHVVTPNKKANSGPLPLFDALHAARRAAGSHYLYEATVGAGLPIIQTLRDLRETGDDVRTIEGIFSGTLAYLFNVWDGSRPFSAVVRDAKANGYTFRYHNLVWGSQQPSWLLNLSAAGLAVEELETELLLEAIFQRFNRLLNRGHAAILRLASNICIW